MSKKSTRLFYSLIGLVLAQPVYANISIAGIEQALPYHMDVEQSLEQHPSVLVARSEMDYAAAYDQKLRLGEHPWTVKTGLQMRRTDAQSNVSPANTSYEPNIGIEKQVRLPNKTLLDYELGNRALTLANLKYSDAWHEASKELLSSWFAYLQALTQVSRLEEQVSLVQNQMDILNQRIRVGDAARLELMLLNTEYLQSKQQLMQAQTVLNQSKQNLSRYFKGSIPAHFSTQQIQVLPIHDTQEDWVTSVLNANHELELAQTQAQQQHALAKRQRLNRIPDPTFGVGYSREQDGTENLISFSVSVPLAGRQVKATANMAEAEARKAEIEAERIKSRLVNETMITYTQFHDAQTRITKSQELYTGLVKQNQLMHKAYKLGEISLNELRLHSRQLIDGTMRLDQAKLDYAQNLALLMLNTHALWAVSDEH